MATINQKSGTKSWAVREPSKFAQQAYTEDSDYYQTAMHKNCRKAYMDSHPLCEVSKYEKKYHAGKVLEHLIPIRFGGAKTDPRNLMSVTAFYAQRKTGIESRKNAPLIAWMDTENGKVPQNREDIVKLLIRTR